jgi:hypothetical protein
MPCLVVAERSGPTTLGPTTLFRQEALRHWATGVPCSHATQADGGDLRKLMRWASFASPLRHQLSLVMLRLGRALQLVCIDYAFEGHHPFSALQKGQSL